ncbi:sigma-70 family RNA polymerase sigma factor [Nostoc sp.]|uniref:sigma-70 family RNA polymerase sigma factor n=1 Tax=Nostoc sp. TaxID=1180 RepID=UPI002FF72B4A
MDSSLVADDASLLTRIAKHDQTALSQLYDRYAKIIYAVAFKSLRSVEESEEVVLDVFAQVWRIADRYDAVKGRADTWLFVLARSRILDRLRKLQRSQLSSPVSTKLSEIQTQYQSVDPIQEVLICERRDRVLSALKLLPSEQRLVIELAYYQGLTHSQIAAQTEMSLGTVKTRIRLGLNKLKSALDAGV